MLSCGRWVFVVWLYQVVALIFLLALAVFHIYLVSVNLTTYEFVHWKRLGMHDQQGWFWNQHDTGLVRNWASFVARALSQSTTTQRG